MSVLAAIPPPPFTGFELGPLNVRLYGLLIAVGALLAFQVVVSRYARSGGDPLLAERAAMLALIGGLLGARIGYVIPRFGDFLSRPGDILAIWQGGLTFFGGLAGGALAVIIYVRVKGGDMPAMADAVAPALPLAQAIGRWGNYFNQELYGRPTELPWGLEVEERFRRPGFTDATTFHPTFLYESLWNLALFGLLVHIDRRGWLRRRGSLLFVYLIGYGIGRGWIEALRIDTAERYLGLSRNNWIAIALVIAGAVAMWWWERHGSGEELTPSRSDAGDADPLADPTATSDNGDVEPGDDASSEQAGAASDASSERRSTDDDRDEPG